MGTYNVHGGHNRIVPGASCYMDEVTEDRKITAGVIALLTSQGHTAYNCTDDSGRTQVLSGKLNASFSVRLKQALQSI